MKSLGRVFVVVLVASLLGVSSLVSMSGEATAQTEQANDACKGQLEVLLLMDQSRSLQSTDPDGLRVSGAKELVKSLNNSAEAVGEKVNIGIAGFGEGAELVGSATLPEQQGQALSFIDEFQSKNTDLNTDYVLALKFASDYFAGKSGVAPACMKLVWFTDGAYSIDNVDAPGLNEYTNSKDKKTIRSQLGDQICGPLPAGGKLPQSLSERIKSIGFSVQMIDLRIGGKEDEPTRVERAETAPVIDRFVGGDFLNPCHVKGLRVESANASDLAVEFFRQGQIALGNYELDCQLLIAGYPASMVSSLAVRNSNVDDKTEILLESETKASGKGFANYSPKDGPATSGTLTTKTNEGSITNCFADLKIAAAAQGNTQIFGKAGKSFLSAAVYGAGSQSAGSGVAQTFATVEATVDGKPAEVAWDDPSRSWKISVPGPLSASPEISVTPKAAGWQGPAFSSTPLNVSLSNEPPAPQVAWQGTSTLEGEVSVASSLRVTPSAINTGGTICVTLEAATAVPSSLTFTPSEQKVCGSDSKPFDIPATLTTSSSSNAEGSVDLPYKATYTPAGLTEEIPIGGTEKVVFAPISLTKPLNTGDAALFTALFLIASIILTLGALLLFTNYQLRLPDPSKFRAVSVPLNASKGSLTRAEAQPIKMDDLERVLGDRSSYRLPNGIEVRRRRTLNPFAAISAFVRSGSGLVGAAPAIGSGFNQRTEVSSSFDAISFVSVDPAAGTGTAVAMVKPGPNTRAEDVAAQIDNALSRLQSGVPGTDEGAVAKSAPTARPDFELDGTNVNVENTSTTQLPKEPSKPPAPLPKRPGSANGGEAFPPKPPGPPRLR